MGDPVGLPVFLGKSHVTVSTGNSKQSILAVSLLGKAENKKGKGKKKVELLLSKVFTTLKFLPPSGGAVQLRQHANINSCFLGNKCLKINIHAQT